MHVHVNGRLIEDNGTSFSVLMAVDSAHNRSKNNMPPKQRQQLFLLMHSRVFFCIVRNDITALSIQNLKKNSIKVVMINEMFYVLN